MGKKGRVSGTRDRPQSCAWQQTGDALGRGSGDQGVPLTEQPQGWAGEGADPFAYVGITQQIEP
jgi:hypothetical protein